jgi:hypothetical protein
MKPPNMRVQRTRSSASPPHSPLTRYPLGRSGAFVALSMLAGVAMSAPGAERPTAAQIAGCYQLEIEPWQPALNLGRDIDFITPPDQVNLTLEKPEHEWRKGSLLVRQVAESRGSIHTSGEWQVSKSGKIEILWTTGFSGLTMDLASVRTGLEGRAKTFWDSHRTPQTAKVHGKRVSCLE